MTAQKSPSSGAVAHRGEQAPPNPARVSVVIPSHNRINDLRECLASVTAQNYPDMEVIVVDDASIDGLPEMVSGEFGGVRLIRNSIRQGACRSRNRGIRESHSDYIWFLDNDCVVPGPDVLRRLVDKSSGGVGCVGGERHDLTGAMVEDAIAFNGRGFQRLHEPMEVLDVGFVTTANCLVSREVVERLGGFDETYEYLYEDTDLGIRVGKLGLRNIICHDTLVHHKASPECRNDGNYRYHRNRIYFILKNFARRTVLLPILDLADAGAALGRRIKTHQDGDDEEKEPIAGTGFLRSVIRSGLALGVKHLPAICGAYLWNLAHLPVTWVHLLRNKRYL